jgi:hypothetical protein
VSLRILLLLLVAPAMAADLVDASRITSFDFQAQRADGVNTNHQSKDAAAFACANWEAVNPGLNCEVQGGRWRVDLNLPTVSAPPVVTPPVVAPPASPGAGVAVLSWNPPSTNKDGTPITGSLTYRLEYGIGNFSTTLPLTGLSYTVTGLSPGMWQFRLYALQGTRVSNPSNTVTKVIQ